MPCYSAEISLDLYSYYILPLHIQKQTALLANPHLKSLRNFSYPVFCHVLSMWVDLYPTFFHSTNPYFLPLFSLNVFFKRPHFGHRAVAAHWYVLGINTYLVWGILRTGNEISGGKQLTPDPTGEGEIRLDGGLWRASLQGQCPQGDNDTPYSICNWQNIPVAIHAELAKQLNNIH